jgi:hypothetical protein
MDADHKVYQYTEDGRDYWQCSCGQGGSAPEGSGDLASDKHIKPEESRYDVYHQPDGWW